MEEFLIFFLILVRIASFLVTSPIFSVRGVPNLLKVGFALILSYLLYLSVPLDPMLEHSSLLAYGIVVAKEALFGMALGFTVNLIFLSFQMAGQMIDFQVGFSMASYYDPLSNSRISLYGRMYYWLGITLFFALNGHHYLIYTLAQSFELVPLNTLILQDLSLPSMVNIFSGSFLIAFQIAVSIIFIILLVDVVIGLLSRTVPQLNILMLGLPLKVLVGMLSTIILLPAIGDLMVSIIESLPYQINDFLHIIPFVFLMAAEEKTEQPTPKKLEDARKKGQVAKSVDLNSAIILLLLVLLIGMLGDYIFGHILQYLKMSLGGDYIRPITLGEMPSFFMGHIGFYYRITLPLLGAIMATGVIANFVQVGFLRSFHPLKPDIKRLNPIEGFKRIFSKRALMEFLKNLLKLIVVGYISYRFIIKRLDRIFSVSKIGIGGIFPLFKELVVDLMLQIGWVMLGLAIMDYIYQRYEFRKSLRMTKHEVKEELKQMEGDPQVKSVIRQKQRQLATRRMMAEIPNATVVITNPSHFAVAIKYDEETTGAPKVVAKGVDYLAQKIKEIAKKEDIPIIENKPLARVLYREVEIGEEIPIELYQAVAEILAIVYQMEKRSKFI